MKTNQATAEVFFTAFKALKSNEKKAFLEIVRVIFSVLHFITSILFFAGCIAFSYYLKNFVAPKIERGLYNVIKLSLMPLYCIMCSVIFTVPQVIFHAIHTKYYDKKNIQNMMMILILDLLEREERNPEIRNLMVDVRDNLENAQ